MSLGSLLTETYSYKTQASVGTDGEPAYSSVSTARCRYQRGRDRGNEDIDHNDVLYTTIDHKPNDLIWPPGDSSSDDTLARRPSAVTKSRAPGNDVTLYKVLL